MTTPTTQRLLQAVSNLLHPLFMLTYGTAMLLTFTVLRVLPSGIKLFLVGEAFLYTCLIPTLCIAVLYRLRLVSHWALRNRGDRGLPLALNAVAYGACAYALTHHGFLPSWALSIYYGGVFMAVAGWIISLWWKVSAHAMGIASLTTASFGLACLFPTYMPMWLPMLLLLLTGLLCSIRLYLGRHTLMQVSVGTMIGVATMTAALWWSV